MRAKNTHCDKGKEKRKSPLFPFLKLVRPSNLLIVILTQYLTAIFLIGPAHQWHTYLLDLKLLVLVLSTVFITAAGYIINDYLDIKIDYINKPNQVLIGRFLKRRSALLSHLILSILGILGGFYISIYIGILNLIVVFWLWLYSSHLKKMPLIGNLSIAFLTAATLILIVLLYNKSMILVLFFASFAFLSTLIREIIKDLEDLYGDSYYGCKTLPVIWGIRKTKAFVLVLKLFLILLIGYFIYWLSYPTSIALYFILFIGMIGFSFSKTLKTDTKKGFHQLSILEKIITLIGILGMLFFG